MSFLFKGKKKRASFKEDGARNDLSALSNESRALRAYFDSNKIDLSFFQARIRLQLTFVTAANRFIIWKMIFNAHRV